MSLMKIMIIATFVFVTCSSLEKASNMRLNSSAVGPHAMKHVYSVYIYEDHYRTKLSLFNRCMYGVFVFTEREGLMRRSQLTKLA